ncbi:major facilitator superfamily domain-containing protein [Sparassis latifolia]
MSMSESTAAQEPAAENAVSPTAASPASTITKDFGFLPIPRHLRHDPEHPAHFGLLLNATFGLASTFLVANIWWCQPILIQLSHSFNVTYDEVSQIPTLIQAGYAVSMLTISILGDIVRRRPMLLLLIFISGSLTIGLAVTNSLVAFEVLSFFVGMASVAPQVLMPLAADLAPPARRASALSIVLAGLLFGVLLARVLAGIIGQYAPWRVVYYLAIAVQFAVLLLLYGVLPDYPARNRGATYLGILASLLRFLATEPLLVQATLCNFLASACFSNFWVTLTFLLGGPPYHYSTLVIGLFGLVGMFGVAMAPVIGRLIDGLIPWFAAFVAVLALLVFQALAVGADGVHIAAVVLVCFGIDVFRQMNQVALTSAVFGLDPNARSRLNAVLIIAFFLGMVMGTSVGTRVFNEYGWRPAAALSLGWTGLMLVVMLLRGPHVPRHTWFGYAGGFEVRKRMLARRAEEEEGAGADGEEREKGSPRGSVEGVPEEVADDGVEEIGREKDPAGMV